MGRNYFKGNLTLLCYTDSNEIKTYSDTEMQVYLLGSPVNGLVSSVKIKWKYFFWKRFRFAVLMD